MEQGGWNTQAQLFEDWLSVAEVNMEGGTHTVVNRAEGGRERGALAQSVRLGQESRRQDFDR